MGYLDGGQGGFENMTNRWTDGEVREVNAR